MMNDEPFLDDDPCPACRSCFVKTNEVDGDDLDALVYYCAECGRPR